MDTPDDKDTRLQEAADWFEQKREGTLDRQAFDQWMRDSRNMEAWLATSKANEGLQKVRGGVELIRQLGLGHDDLAGPDKPSDTSANKLNGSPITRRRALLWLAGGSGVFAVGLSAYLANANESARTSVGEQRIINLPDGAVLDLNTDSKACWKINDSTRNVWLERGELALTTHHASRPFVVLEQGRPLIAISDGTLNVRRTGANLNVTVVQGTAEVQAPSRPSALPSGMGLSVSKQSQEIVRVAPSELHKVALWKQRQLSFDGETLAQAVAEFNRYLPNKIVVKDQELNSLRILATGNWRIDAPDEFLESLSASFELSVHRETGGGYLIEKKIAGAHR